MEESTTLSSSFVITFILLLSYPSSIQCFGLLAVEHDWILRLEKLRAEALDRLFPRVVNILYYAIDPFGVGFVDYRDPLELISFITLYLPGVVFMTVVLFFSIPHILNFVLFMPKLWFFNLPCLYSFNTSLLKRRRRRRDAVNEVTPNNGPCDAANLAHITRLVFKGLVKLTEQQ